LELARLFSFIFILGQCVSLFEQKFNLVYETQFIKFLQGAPQPTQPPSEPPPPPSVSAASEQQLQPLVSLENSSVEAIETTSTNAQNNREEASITSNADNTQW
jgi:hypothetical protein